MIELTLPVIFIIIMLGVFGYKLTDLYKKVVKKHFILFYKSKVYEYIKLFIPILFCLIIALLTPDSIYNLLGYIALLSDKIWFGVISGLLSGLSFQVFKKALMNFSNITKKFEEND